MSPQPLSTKRTDAPTYFGPFDGVHAVSEDIAIAVSDILGTWSYIEHDLRSLASAAMGANANAVSEILTAFRNDRARHDAIIAAMERALKPEHLDWFLEVMKVVSPVQNLRHRLAHDVWATVAGQPDWLVLVEPRHLDRVAAVAAVSRQSRSTIEKDAPESDNRLAGLKNALVSAPHPDLVPREQCQVYTLKELRDGAMAALRAHILIGALEILVSPSHVSELDRSDEIALRMLKRELQP